MLTFDEYVNLVPTNAPPPMVMDILLRYKQVIEDGLPAATALVTRNAVALRAKGLNIPDRFFPRPVQDPAERKQELLRVVTALYREYLTEKYNAPLGGTVDSPSGGHAGSRARRTAYAERW